MQRLTGIMLVVAVGAATLSGCALRDPRDDYAYGRADGLWDTSYDLIDWNFPTSANQGPIETPKRLRLEPTAIGVTWATRNPIPLNDNLPAQDMPAPAASNDGAGTQLPASVAPAAGVAGPAAPDRERSGIR